MAGGLINTQLPAICFFITVENGIIADARTKLCIKNIVMLVSKYYDACFKSNYLT